ncbi:hypothetical protein [Deinococcus yunweiensis]|uniref:hypothetical protein n=1 Tax=Deinococcus yunweiensis TaxID=367282 RepID=UPI00398F1E8A
MPAHALVLGIKRAAVLLTLATTARLRGLIIVTARGMESTAFPYDNLAPQDFKLPIANSYWSGPQDHVRILR